MRCDAIELDCLPLKCEQDQHGRIPFCHLLVLTKWHKDENRLSAGSVTNTYKRKKNKKDRCPSF